ncbi:MAG: VWA domain-containing protein [Phycisphaerae bacterium]|nr:VWA domain-containing protein [Phycisphaerae bacterium]
MPVTFEQPWWLVAALLAVPSAVIGLRWFTAMSRARAWSAVTARAVLLVILAAALAGASAVRTTERMAVIAVVDVSESVRQYADLAPADGGKRPAYTDAIKQWLQTAVNSGASGADDLFGVIVFDGASAAAMLPRVVTGSASVDASAVWKQLSLEQSLVEGTNIGSALRFAGALFPPDTTRRLVLVSDGNETDGNALDAARRLASASGVDAGGIPVDVLPISYRVSNEVMIDLVDAPPQSAEGSTVSVRVVLSATQETRGTLELLYADQAVDINGPAPGTGRPITLKPGRNVESIEVRLEKGKPVHRFRPVFTAERASQDRLSINNTAEAFTVTPSAGAVLIVDGVGGGAPDSPARMLARTLERADITVRVGRVEELPTDLISYQEFDLVVLNDVAAEEVPTPVQQLLADYVSELGGGMVMVGGPDSFGAGGWKGTPIEAILPVNIDLPEQLLVPSAAVVLVIDNSGSMSAPVGGGLRSQQEIANQGAALAVETLDRTDMLCVIAFNSDFQIIVPMERNTDARSSAAKVRAIGAGGGTNLYPALGRAMQELSRGEAAKASVRHVIVLSDGRSEPPNGSDSFESLAARMHERGITVSTISVGDGADNEQLARIALEGGGQFYQVVDPNLLPRIFVKEIRVVRKPLIREAPFVPVDLGSGSGIIAGMPRPMPPLNGLVLTQRRKDATVTNILATPEGEPVLSTWFVGRGRVAGFTSDAHRWAREWIDWPGYAAMWTQIVRQTARPTAERSGELTTELEGDDLVIRYDAVDEQGRPRDLLTIPGVLYGPGGERVEIKLFQVGSGVYEGRVRATQRGNYYVVLLPQQGDRRLSSIIGGASRAVGAEYRVTQSNVGLLRSVAEITGGRLLDPARPEDANLFDRGGVRPIRAASPVWSLLLAWAVAVLVLDIGTRRVAWDRLLSKELAREWREQAASAVRARSEQAAATVASLKRATERAGEPASGAPAPEKLVGKLPDEPAAEPGRERLRVQMAPKPRAEDDVTQNAPSPSVAPDSETSTTSGLLAAKRRAAKRFDSGAEPGTGG